MFGGDRDQDTICAVSTPSGVGGVSLIRVSGSQALSVVRKITSNLKRDLQTHHCYFSKIRDAENNIIDECLVTYFKEGQSFTGQECVEISCHGNPRIVRKILDELVSNGCRIAERGEFTYRSFMSGKIDLVQAESILSLIQAQSDKSIQQSLRQLGGKLSRDLKSIESDLVWCLAHLEAGIDFSTEGIEVLNNAQLEQKFNLIYQSLQRLTESYKKGKVINEGIKMSLVGRPNVGKSSLLNLLVEEEKAIVTDVPGTTRDTIEAGIFLGGIKLILVDTAGIRNTTDMIEKIGIERSYKAISDSDIVLFVFDVFEGLSLEEEAEINKIPINKIILIGNKSDKGMAESLDQISKRLSLEKKKIIYVSAHNSEDKEAIRQKLFECLEINSIEDESLIFQARHQENLTKAMQNLTQAKELLKSSFSNEFLALEMKEALLFIQQTIGIQYDDQILDRVFKEFCIGK